MDKQCKHPRVQIVAREEDAAGEEQHVPEPSGYAALWSGVIADGLDRVRRGEPPPTTPRDTARAVSLVFEAYEKAATLA